MDAALPASLAWSLAHRPEVVQAGRYPMSENCRGFIYRAPTIALHQHGYEGILHIGDDEYELRHGDLTLTPAGIPSQYHLPRPGHHLCIHFSVDAAVVVEAVHALALPCHVRLGAAATSIQQRIWWITDMHRRAAHADQRKRALALAAASAGLQELMLTLALADPLTQLTDTISRRLEDALRAVVETVEARIREPLAVPELAEGAQLSQNYLARVFRQRYGVTIPHFILIRRVELARHLLATTRASVKQVAAEVGLPDVQHFNKQFRRLVGTSPSAYRQTQHKTHS